MSTKSKSDISNSAIRMLLQTVGSYYDDARGFPRFNKRGSEWAGVVKFFNSSCCYCGTLLDADSSTDDHLIPINQTSLGLHAWGNVVPCCRHCNKEKHSRNWQDFLKEKSHSEEECQQRMQKLKDFQKIWKYNPSLQLSEIAHNLYEDVGEISATLIKLRVKQAQDIIRQSLGIEK